MNCYYHSHEEGVVACARCGVALCRECEQQALFRTDNGTGQAFCKRCGLQAAQEIVMFDEKWLQKRAIKLGAMGVFILLGLGSWLVADQGVINMFVCFAIAGGIANIGDNSSPGDIKQQVIDAERTVHYPISTLVGKLIGYTFFAPFLFIANVIGYMKTKSQYKQDLLALEEAKAAAEE